jgi:hypothetical protein
VEVMGLLQDPDFVATSRRMAEQALADGPTPDPGQLEFSRAVGDIVGPAARSGLDPSSSEALAIIERIEAIGKVQPEARQRAADRIEAFTGRRVGRYWSLVGILNGWVPSQAPNGQAPDDVVDIWEWYAKALRAHS